MVQRDGKNSYLLMSGQRRLAALKRLGAKKIPVLLLNNSTRYDLEDAKAASVVENLHRNKMDTRDMTAACVFLSESVGKGQAAKSLADIIYYFEKVFGICSSSRKITSVCSKGVIP